MARPLLIIFYNNPALGKIKPRLAATIGDDNALAIYLNLVSNTRAITDELPYDKAVFYSDYVDTEDNWNNALYKKYRQNGHNAGKRLQNALTWGFREGYSSVCVLHADCYGLNPQIIIAAFEYLEEGEAVIGPARDGGYYLLGTKKIYQELFRDKLWGSHTVLSDTLQNFEELDLDYGMLPVLNEVEEEVDLPRELKRFLSLQKV
jgi:rSAM/selenodomain-associated transferase 1